MFTHHQKTIIVDSEILGGRSQKRRIVSFVGGIDLYDGRYDTLDHPFFCTLDTVHHDDFYQPNFLGSSIRKGGPREPWHDIHCRLEGQLLGMSYIILSKVSGFPEKPVAAAAVGLVNGKDNIIDRSIQDAYIHAIRRANNFIYIKNQYFVGSSYNWKSDDIKVEDIGALHLIPKEISLKIVSKIEAGERFTVYIVIPMWPEGIPVSGSVQAILDWQKRTMEMMYTDIAQALSAKGLTANLRDT
ncbi:unnamed protein product [Ilex paraguariensis]|uniref:phospholipase D n=1 Tax=Ilex paraguariensis TaxID=185542 RepID=A0ABC8TLS0_9AQUA